MSDSDGSDGLSVKIVSVAVTLLLFALVGGTTLRVVNQEMRTTRENATIQIKQVDKIENAHIITASGMDMSFKFFYTGKLPNYVEKNNWVKATYNLDKNTITEFHGKADRASFTVFWNNYGKYISTVIIAATLIIIIIRLPAVFYVF